MNHPEAGNNDESEEKAAPSNPAQSDEEEDEEEEDEEGTEKEDEEGGNDDEEEDEDGGDENSIEDHDDEEDEDDDDDDDDDEEDEDEDEEPKLKYARLTQHMSAVYRNGDATSAFVVAGDKMMTGTHNGNIVSRGVYFSPRKHLGLTDLAACDTTSRIPPLARLSRTRRLSYQYIHFALPAPALALVAQARGGEPRHVAIDESTPIEAAGLVRILPVSCTAKGPQRGRA